MTGPSDFSPGSAELPVTLILTFDLDLHLTSKRWSHLWPDLDYDHDHDVQKESFTKTRVSRSQQGHAPLPAQVAALMFDQV